MLGETLERIIECIMAYVRGKFSGKITLHFHEGVVKKVTKESAVEY